MTTNIGVVFDFDDTLAPDSTTHLLKEYDISPDEFWNESFRKRVQNGFDPTVAYLTLLLDHIGENEPLGELTPKEMERCAESLENKLYDGVPEIFDNLDVIGIRVVHSDHSREDSSFQPSGVNQYRELLPAWRISRLSALRQIHGLLDLSPPRNMVCL